MTEARTSFEPGDVFAGKYRIERVLGQGGMGVVVAARHLQLDDRVAIKFMRSEISADANAGERFMREARASAKVKSQHIARVFDVGAHDGVLFMVMEHLEGTDLAGKIASEGPLAPGVAVDYVLQACDAIGEAHAHGIVHRDLKPENLFLTWRNSGEACIKVLDFGISKIETGAHRMTSTGGLMGSPVYMSPEQLVSARDVDGRSDIWGLGVVLFELLTGTHPFMAETLPQLVVQIRESPAPLLRSLVPSAPAALEAVVAKCLAKNPAARFSGVRELTTALQTLALPAATGAPAVGIATAKSPEGDPRRTDLSWHQSSGTRPPTGPKRAVAVFGVLAAVGVVLGGYALVVRYHAAPPPVAAAATDAVAATVAVAATLPSAPVTSIAAAPGAEPLPVVTAGKKPKSVTTVTTRPKAEAGALPAPPDDRK